MSIHFKGKYGPMLIAEIGGNHEGDAVYARELTKLAIQSNVDVIKYQIYSGSKLVNKKIAPERTQHFKNFELDQEIHIELAQLCLKNNIAYSASIWDETIIDWIDPYLSFYKIGSGDLTAYPLLEKIAQKQKPIVLSTGLSSLEEIREAVKYIESINSFYKKCNNLAILQCTSLYPNADEDVNLNVIKTLTGTFKNPIGYSDHTTGTDALRVAYSMGAKILEFHFTDTIENKTFRDHFVSLTPLDVKNLIENIRLINRLQGSNDKIPLQKEIDTNHLKSFRRGVYPTRDIKKGEVISVNDITILRPNCGIDARDFNRVPSKVAKNDIPKLSKLSWDMFVDEQKKC